ncbi:MAG: glycosyltransferase, partial [Planctomycetota bacterium]
VQDALSDLQGELQRREEILFAELSQLYAQAQDLSQILNAAERPLRILIAAPIVSAYQQFCARDMDAAFNQLGVDASTYLVGATQCWLHDFAQHLTQLRPDGVLIFSKHRGSIPGLPHTLPLIVWDQDYAVASDKQVVRRLGPRDRLFTLLAEWTGEAIDRGIPAKRTEHLNLGANTAVFTPPEWSCQEALSLDSGNSTGRSPVYSQRECDHDILFVGNIHPLSQYRKMIDLDAWPDSAQRIMLEARIRLLTWLLERDETEPFVIPDMEPLLEAAAEEIELKLPEEPKKRLAIVNYFRYRIAHYVVRQAFIESLSEFRLGLYGTGWEHFSRVAHLARPPIENGQPMLEVMHRSSIQLQLHTWTVHHPRLYDTASAGGFLLVGRVDELHPLERAFTPGEHLDTFGSIAELHTKIRHYLDHPEDRERMARNAAEHTAQHHTMNHRVQELLEHLQR